MGAQSATDALGQRGQAIGLQCDQRDVGLGERIEVVSGGGTGLEVAARAEHLDSVLAHRLEVGPTGDQRDVATAPGERRSHVGANRARPEHDDPHRRPSNAERRSSPESSSRISALCSPSSGERTTSTGESDSVNGQPTVRNLPALRMVDLDDHPARREVGILEQLAGVKDRPARDTARVELSERFPLVPLKRPALNRRKDLREVRQACLGGRVLRVLHQVGAADLRRERLPDLWLDDQVQVVVGAAAVAAHRPPWVPSTRGVARSGHAVAELPVGILV